MSSETPGGFRQRLASAQANHPWRFVIAGLLLVAASVPLIRQLGLNSSFSALLPRNEPSVVDLEKTRARVGGLNQLTVALLASDRDALLRFAADLVPRLQALAERDPRIFSVEWNISSYEDFVYQHRHLYADLDDLREIRDELGERLDYERLKRNPFWVQLEEPPESPEALIERLTRKADEAKETQGKFPGGYYLHPDGDLLALFLRTDIGGGDFDGTQALLDAVTAEVDALQPTQYAPDLRVQFAGRLMAAQQEHLAIIGEAVLASSLTVVLVLLVVLLFFRRPRAVPLLALAVSAPVAVSFGVAELTVDYLNTSTAFLGSIVLGNGVNPNIIWLARYFEERRRGAPLEAALTTCHQTTMAATATASLAAAFAYGSLVLTDFRGFRDFGIIGGVGMVLCWLGAYLLLPALVVLSERARPLRFVQGATPRNLYGRAFFAVVERGPRAVLALSVVATLASAALVYVAIVNDPLEYDFRKLKSVREGTTQVVRINRRINEFLPSASGNGIAVLAPSLEEADALYQELIRRREAGAPYGAVRSIRQLLPADQEEKIPLLKEIREQLQDARQYVDAEQQARIDEHIPPAELKPLGPEDLPEAAARVFTERDGTRGRILFVDNDLSEGVSIWDGKYLIRWTEALRALRLADGSRPPLAGQAPVFADMVAVVMRDGPRAVLASLLATTLLLLVAFRRARERVATLAALLLGILWMAGTMALLRMRLNFLNFVAFPITFGNGADYGVNVMRRQALEDPDDGVNDPARRRRALREAVQESGGAVILCSLTTIIGYSTLLVSANQAMASFGTAMAISEVTCLLSAVLTVPAYLWWRLAKAPQDPGSRVNDAHHVEPRP